MAGSTYFVQECPTCGRCLHIRVEYLGRPLVCQHCRGRLLAQDSAGTSQSPSESGLALLRRADELLDMVEQGKAAQSKTDPRAVEQRKFRPR